MTANELKVLKAIRENFFQNGDPTCRSGVWVDSINDSHADSGITGKALSGVVSSLTAKKLVYTDGEVISLTELGERLSR